MTDARIEPSGLDPLETALPASPLSASRTLELWMWLRTQRRARARGLHVRAAEIRSMMRPLCDQARERGGRVEQLIVLLKQLWAMLPPETGGRRLAGSAAIDWREREHELLDLIVGLCIDEFYFPLPFDGGRPSPVQGTAADGPRA